jgi:transposase-like protein
LPKLAAFLDEAGMDVRACMTLPAQHRAKLHPTTPIERLNGESKRHTAAVAIFPTKMPSSVSSAPSCSNKTPSGPSSPETIAPPER